VANGENRTPHREAVLVEPNLASIAKGLEALIVRQEAVEHVLIQLVKLEHESGKKRDALQGILMPLALRSGLVNPEKLKEALNAP
jgi:hypothetical protein